jgi:hypothetical protein
VDIKHKIYHKRVKMASDKKIVRSLDSLMQRSNAPRHYDTIQIKYNLSTPRLERIANKWEKNPYEKLHKENGK